MKHHRLWQFGSVLLLAALIVSGCAAPAPQVIEKIVTQVVEKQVEVVQTQVVEVEKEVEKIVEVTAVPAAAETSGVKTLRLNMGPGDIPTIDTALAVDVSSVQIIDSATVGLMRQNAETAQLEKGMAADYTVSDDGLTYTFNLLEGVPWVKYDSATGQVVKVQDCEGNDRTVTADDFVYGILRTLNPETASDYAYVLSPVITGAADYNEGTVTDTATVGVKAIDPATLEITVTSPAVYNLNILGLWVAHAQPGWLIDGDDCTDARGERWTEQGFYQGYGPYTLKEWIHDDSITLIKNPFWPGIESAPQAKIDELHWVMLDTSPALAEFEAENLDVAGIPSGDMDRMVNDPVYKDMVDYTYTIGTEFYAFNTQKAPTDDARVRKALSLAIDRQSLVENVNKGSGLPAQWFSHPGAAGSPQEATYPDLGVKYDPEAAKAVLDEYLTEKGLTADQLQVTLMFNTSEAHKQRAEAIQAMWKDTLGIDVQLSNQEWKVYLTQRQEGTENIYRGSWVQDYPDANNFTADVFGADGAYADVVDWQSDAYDALWAQAAEETDAAKRMALYADAEKILIEDEAVIAPLYWYRSPRLVRPTVSSLVSITGYDQYEKWDIE